MAVLPMVLLPFAATAAETVAPPDLPPADVWVRTDGGTVRVLDKQKAQSQVLKLKIGQSATFESLNLTMVACVVRPPDLPANAAAFLQIADSRAGEPGFRGWMLSGQPWLASLQSPVYALRVIGCVKPTDAQVEAAVPPKPPVPVAAPTPAVQVQTPTASPSPPAVSAPPAGSDLNPPPGQDLDNPNGQ